ncbi:thermonuclease family protein [Methylobacterium thuringiense]|uniref:Nuclease n=1 Tax=Methylobacterium thuringiense TaxID=1003091 RepID=A0ABQ4TJ84_9HYPH|nr:thermonuclease family protein [Methylobacterium thuringiense]GJE54852.1 hypothetical protein EKPJFOCH_1337 [Methylobacterium thuringiense]
MPLAYVVVLAGALAGAILYFAPTVPRTNRTRLPGLVLVVVSAASPAVAAGGASGGDLLKGRATVIDGSSLVIDGVPVTLFGIVTPASDATCWDAREAPYACGRQVSAELTARIGSEALICERRERPNDRPAKVMCQVGQADLGDWMISHGYAMPAGDAPASYRQARDHAWGRRAGLWGGVFDYPTDWSQAVR